MGIKNKQRRAAKARAKRRSRDHTGQGSRHSGWSNGPQGDRQPPPRTPSEHARRLLGLVASAPPEFAERFSTQAATVLAGLEPAVVDRESERALASAVELLWCNGWQPAELVRQARRTDARAGRMVAMAVAADHAGRDERTLHPRWSAQIDGLRLPRAVPPKGWMDRFAWRETFDRLALVTTVVVALQTLYRLGPLKVIIPPPGDADRRWDEDPGAGIDDPVLVRVRALLAQAESTTFEAEAEAFTAKAQELMARHAIDMAMLWARSARDERPTSIRLPVDDPYADIKSLLLQRVAKNSRCATVHHADYALSTVVGFVSDVAATEMLFTSLLVQSHAAMQAEAAKTGPGGRARSRRFRSSFLLAFSQRIDERLRAISTAVTTTVEAERSETFLPVLVARERAVDDMVAELFGELQSTEVRGGSDAAGWARGTFAADLARLNFGDLDDTEESAGRAAAGPVAQLPLPI